MTDYCTAECDLQRCIKGCEGNDDEFLCGDNGIVYSNECELLCYEGVNVLDSCDNIGGDCQ